MFRKRFVSIILTILMVISIVPETRAKATTLGKKPCIGVALKTINVYSDIKCTVFKHTLYTGESFTLLGTETIGIAYTAYKINYNKSGAPNEGYYGYISKDIPWNNEAIIIYGSLATVKWNVSVYYGPNNTYQRCGTLYANEKIVVIERGETYSYIEYNDNVHGRRKRAYVNNGAITLDIQMEQGNLAIDTGMVVEWYIGPYYQVYSGPSVEYEPIGSVSGMKIYWIDRTNPEQIDQLFYGMTYIKYQVTGTNTWKTGYIAYPYTEIKKTIL